MAEPRRRTKKDHRNRTPATAPRPVPPAGEPASAGAALREMFPRDPVPRTWVERSRWVFLLAAIAVLVAFLVAQHQSTSTRYGPESDDSYTPGSAGELSGARVPSDEQLTAELKKSAVVRLPGAIANWDADRVRAANDGKQPRVLVAPPGLDDKTQDRLSALNDSSELEDVYLVLGTKVSGGFYEATPDRATGWAAQYALGDVTDLLVTLIDASKDRELPDDDTPVQRRDPSAAELAKVSAALRDKGSYVASGATLTKVPTSSTAFGRDARPLYVALPLQQQGRPLVHFGPALAREFPGRPVVVMYGQWIEYDGPAAADFSEVAAASYYGQFGDRLSRFAYPQDRVLGTYLNRVNIIRYSGLYGRPLPYTPFDPLRVALPALPWIFVVCAVAFLALSARSLLRPPRKPLSGAVGVPARLAGLTALAVEISNLAIDERSSAALARAITQLGAAREAMAEKLRTGHVNRLLDAAESELDATATQAGWPDYRPSVYLQWRLV